MVAAGLGAWCIARYGAGVLLGLSMLAAYAFYAHAFTSVWCFFAAAISFFMVYLLYRETR